MGSLWGLQASRVRLLLMLLAGLLLLGLSPVWAQSGTVTRMEVTSDERGTTIAILSLGVTDLQVRTFTLENPRRLVFDLADVALAPGVRSPMPLTGLGLSQARVKQFQQSTVRLVLDLTGDAPPPVAKVERGKRAEETVITLSSPDPLALEAPKVSTREGTARVRLLGAAGLAHRLGALGSPPRVFVDLGNAEVAASRRESYAKGAVREVRLAPHAAADGTPGVRVVVELQEALEYWEEVDGRDLILCFARGEDLPAPDPASKPGSGKALRGKRIVVDPGHGGKDSGALSASEEEDAQEKDIALDLGLRLARLLRAQGAEVTMTREDDTFIPLGQRSQIANDLGADAFISIHCNSCAAPNTLHGTAVYYDHEDSAAFAQCVQQELVPALGSRDNGVRNANFSVIRRSQCPGILVETAFINHDEDRKLLTDPTVRERAAQAIVKGVIDFFARTGAGQ